ncbi:craniofacial development protein 2-like [Apostichopus japonicus]|uniref:craniofacial development protein 2-like n=1 Tax=Stichopus japonicus TaxID=307972 RepID=UPI003AB3403E
MNRGKLDIVFKEMDRTAVEILGISELKWTDMGHFQSNGCKVFFSGHERIKRNGVALICNKTTAASVLGYNPVNDRMISIRLDGQPVKTTIIQVYAPTSAASDEDTQNFYGRLQDLVDSVPRGDALVIMGDWNAKIGEEPVAGISGRHGLGERNEAGERMLDFCEANRLVISNTWFQQPKRRLYTWTSPDGQYRNQIDYILVRKRWQSAVKSANTLPGADCGTDHELLVAIIHIKLRKVKKQDRVKKYSLNEIPERYSIEVKNSFAALDLTERKPDELWQEVEDIIKKAADRNIPRAKKQKKSKWLSKKAIEIADKRRGAKKQGIHNREFRQLNADFQYQARKDKEII